jgi:hypothetical protein
MQKFCHNCGKQIVAGANFCPFCGTNLSSLSAKPTPATVVPEQKKTSQFTPFAVGRDDEDDEYIDKIAHLDIKQDGLQVEIIKDMPMGETLGSVVSSSIGAGAPPQTDPARPAQYNDREVFLKDFQREAGTIRHEK